MESSAGELIILDTTDSTNNYAMGLIKHGMAGHGDAIFAHMQTAGKGRQGKTWNSQPGQNLALSIILKPTLDLHLQFQLSAAVAVACHKLLTKYIDDVKIKWPNDLYSGDRKAGGILIENSVQGNQWLWAVVGVGLNINQVDFNPDLPNPVSLKKLAGRDYDPLDIAGELKALVYEECALLSRRGFGNIYEYYNLNLYKRGETIRLKKANAAFETSLIRVATDGKLEVKDVLERSFSVDEVQWEIRDI